jgi:ribulose kinase
MDVRAMAEADRTTEFVDKHPVLTWSGGGDAAEWLVPKAMWIATHEPEVWARAARVVEAVDYLSHRLTGRWTASQMNAVCKWNYDPLARVVPTGLYADLGIDGLADKLPAEVLPVGSVAGTLSARAAAELGIAGEPLVAVGGIDAHMSLLACGRAEPGLISIVGGTSTVLVAEASEPIPSTAVWGPYPDALHTGQWLVEGGQVSSGSVLRWLCEDVLGTTRDELPRLVAQARDIEPGSHGLLMLDHFMGNRTPYRDPRLRGAALGLTVGTTPAQLYRAAVEAVALGTRAALQAFEDAGVSARRLVLSGGIRHNPLWVEVTSEVLGRPLELVDTDNLTLRAGAVAAAAAAGVHPDLASASAAFAPPTRTVAPSTGHASVYDAGYERYVRATEALTPVLHELAVSTSGS